jgi:cytochrome c oxidase assembly protein subunit 15
LTIILAVWLWISEPRRWLRWLGVAALIAVIAQGVLGGLTVLFFLPAAVSTAHAGLAEIFFCMTVAIALFTSPGWIAGYEPAQDRLVEPRAARTGVDDLRLRQLATTTTILIYTQILIGATMRHTGAGLAIPDFPLMFGGLVPDHWSSKIAIHFAHRTGALVVVLAVFAMFLYARAHHRGNRELMRPVRLIVALVTIQITLGALTVLSLRDPWINSFHVVCGALVLATSLVLTLRTWRARFATAQVRLKPSFDVAQDGPEALEGPDATTVVRGVRLQADRPASGARA